MYEMVLFFYVVLLGAVVPCVSPGRPESVPTFFSPCSFFLCRDKGSRQPDEANLSDS